MTPTARSLAFCALLTTLAGVLPETARASAALDRMPSPAPIWLAQAETSAPLRERLQRENPADSRRRTVAPVPVPAGVGEAALSVPANPREVDKLKRVQRLIDEVEQRRGTELGTVRVRSTQDGGIRLEHDLSKMRGNFVAFGASPFGGDAATAMSASPNVTAVVMPADVEYRVEQSHTGGEQVVGIRSSGDVAATAFKSGEAPVSLKVTTADLTAQQIAGAEEELPVDVKVGAESRQMRPGEVARFGRIEVVIQASSNRSARKTQIEGAPYALRLEVRPVK